MVAAHNTVTKQGGTIKLANIPSKLYNIMGVAQIISVFDVFDDVDEALVARAEIVYCEGYLWDTELAKAAIDRAQEARDRSRAQVKAVEAVVTGETNQDVTLILEDER